MSDLFIIAAGKGTRMSALGSLPKALMDVGGKSNLQNTLEKAEGKFDQIYIVANSALEDVWLREMDKIKSSSNHKLIFIESGLGDGHAVLAALRHRNVVGSSKFVTIVWGDVYVPDAGIFAELLSNTQHIEFGKVPVANEYKPYVTILTNDALVITGADFTKLGEGHSVGFHDQSIFLFNRVELEKSLSNLHNAFWKTGRYLSPNGELSLLFAFHEIYNTNKGLGGLIAYQTDFPTMGFNTPDELDLIRKAFT